MSGHLEFSEGDHNIDAQKSKTLIDIYVQGSMNAAVLHLKPADKTPGYEDRLTAALKAELKAGYGEFISDVKALGEATLMAANEGFVRNFLNVQCNHTALKAIERMRQA